MGKVRKDEILNTISESPMEFLTNLGCEEITCGKDGIWEARCPFPDHEDNNPSFHFEVHGDGRGAWKCWGCHREGGDAFLLIRDVFELDEFPTIIEETARLAGLNIEQYREEDTFKSEPMPQLEGIDYPVEEKPIEKKKSPPKSRKKTKREESLELDFEALLTIHERYRKEILKDTPASASIRKSLEAKWNLSAEQIEKFQVGFQPEATVQGNYYPHRVTIVVRGIDGQVKNLRKYCSVAKEHGKPKVTNQKPYGSPARLLGIYELVNNPHLPVLIVAGEKDYCVARSILEASHVIVTSTGGEGYWDDEWSSHFAGRDVVICYDVDIAGIRGTEKVGRSIQDVVHRLRVVVWPEDFQQMYPKGDLADYAMLHRSPEIIPEFINESVKKRWDEAQTPEEKQELVTDGHDDPYIISGDETQYITKNPDETPPCYIHHRILPNGKKVKKKISSFIMQMVFEHIYKGEDGEDKSYREVKILGMRDSASFVLPPKCSANVNHFKETLMSKGPYTFTGDSWALAQIWDYEHNRCKADQTIKNHAAYGYLDGRYLLGSVVVDTDGEVKKADENGIVWLANGEGYRPLYGHDMGSLSPSFDIDDIIEGVTKEEKEEVFQCFHNFWNPLRDFKDGPSTSYHGDMLIGLMITTMFSDKVFEANHCVPIGYMFGQQQSGKTSFCTFCTQFFGFEGLKVYSQCTPFALFSAMENLVNILFVLDDFKNEVRKTNGLDLPTINAMFDRTPRSTKPMMSGEVIIPKYQPPLGVLMMNGQIRPKAADLLSRMIIFPFNAENRCNASYERLLELQHKFLPITLSILQQGHGDLLKDITMIKKLLKESGINDRKAKVYAMCAAGAIRAGTVKKIDLPLFFEWLINEASIQESGEAEQDYVAVFWTKITTLTDQNKLKVGEDFRWIPEKQAVGLKLTTIMSQIYESHRKETGDTFPLSKEDITHYLNDHGMLLKKKRRRVGEKNNPLIQFTDARRRGILVDINKLPDYMRCFFMGDDYQADDDDLMESTEIEGEQQDG